MIGGYASPQQQQWWENFVQQQQQRYQQQLQAIHGLTYQNPPASPASYGFGGLANPLLQRASVPLLAQTNPGAANLMLQQYMMQAGQPGDTGISSDPRLLGALMGQSGV